MVARSTRRANQIYFLERACQAQIAAQAGGGKLVLPPESVRLRTAAQFHDFPDVPFYCDLAWEAALRSLTWRTDSALLLTIAGLVFREEKAQVGNYRRERAVQTLIRHMGLLFVPAGAGVIAETGILRLEWLPIAAGLIRSTLLSLAVIGLV